MGVVSLRSSVVLSAAFHACLLFAWMVVLSQQAAQHSIVRHQTLIEIVRAPDEMIRKKSQEDLSRRVVQTIQGEKSEVAAPNAFLGERTQTVERQTVNSNRLTKMGTRPEMKRQMQREKDLANWTDNKVKPLSRLGIGLPKVATKKASPKDDANWANPSGEALPQDYVRGLRESDRTALNTKEYVFYGYYQRIRSRLDLAWEGVLRDKLMKLYRGGRHLATDMDLVTKVMVTLDTKGEVVRVQVIEESGTHDLDDAAIKAFNLAGPFPNPPKGIVDANGHIKIRWDFVLKT